MKKRFEEHIDEDFFVKSNPWTALIAQENPSDTLVFSKNNYTMFETTHSS
jgi:hypothetical protein